MKGSISKPMKPSPGWVFGNPQRQLGIPIAPIVLPRSGLRHRVWRKAPGNPKIKSKLPFPAAPFYLLVAAHSIYSVQEVAALFFLHTEKHFSPAEWGTRFRTRLALHLVFGGTFYNAPPLVRLHLFAKPTLAKLLRAVGWSSGSHLSIP